MVDLPDEVKNMSVRPQEPAASPRPAAPRGERSGGYDRGERSGGYDRGERSYRGGGDKDDRGGRGGDRDDRGGRGAGAPRRRRRLFWSGKVCVLCVKKISYLDYKDIEVIRRFVSQEGKMLPRRLSGTCAHHQRMVTMAVKRARNLGLLPFTGSK